MNVGFARGLPEHAAGHYDLLQRRSIGQKLEFALACGATFFAPINFVRLADFYFTAGDAFACGCLMMMLINGSLSLRPIGPGTAFWIFGLALLAGGLLTSSLLAGDADRALILVGQYLFAYLLLPIILLARPWAETTALMRVFVASIAVMVLHGIYVVDIVGERHTVFVSGSGRLQGFVERENEFGSLVALTVPMILAMGMTRIIPPLLALALLPLLTYGVMLTGSNTALFALVCGLGLVLLARLTLARIIFAAVALQVLGILVSLQPVRDSLPAVFQRRVLHSLETGNVAEMGTFVDRLHLIREALTIVDQTTFLGLGADRYREISDFSMPVHNLYLLLWAEGGLPALMGFLIMLTGGLIVAIKTLGTRGASVFGLCALATLILFAGVINAVPHVYGRFWAVPLILSLAPGVSLLLYGTQRGVRLASPE